MAKKTKKNKFTVLKDTREKNGWDFESHDSCEAVITETIKTGDYTIKGFEEQLCIERKARTSEIAMNLGRYRDRFERELERMTAYKYSYILLEFDVDDLMSYPKGSGIPLKRWKSIKVTGRYMLNLLIQFEIQYGVNVIFCGDKENAEYIANTIFKKVIDAKKTK